VHPSPKLQAAVGWRSPIAATVRVEAAVTHAHPECGNGVTWSLELRRGATRQRLATGVAQGSKEVKVPPVEQLTVQPDDLLSLLIGPRDGNHSCDLTSIELVITAGSQRLAMEPGARSLSRCAGRQSATGPVRAEAVWHFYTEPDKVAARPGR
jgi:hypothetical protein